MECGIQPNFLQSNSYQLILPRFPKVQYFATDFVIPDIELPFATAPTPYTDMRLPGDKPVFGLMNFNFMVDDTLSNYKEVFDWLNSIGTSNTQIDYTNFTNKDSHQPLGEQDAMVMILSSKGNPIGGFRFLDSFPVALGGMPMTSQDPGTNYVKVALTMAYTRFEFL